LRTTSKETPAEPISAHKLSRLLAGTEPHAPPTVRDLTGKLKRMLSNKSFYFGSQKDKRVLKND
jgi:hypothetical protein